MVRGVFFSHDLIFIVMLMRRMISTSKSAERRLHMVFVCLVTVSYHCRSKHEQKRQQRYVGVQLGLLVGITMVITSISLDITYGFGSQEE